MTRHEFRDISNHRRLNSFCRQIPSQRVSNTESVSTWRRHLMETFSALLAICAGISPVTGEFPTQRPVTRSFDVFFDLHLDKRLSKQSWGWWFKTSSRPLWRHCNDVLASSCKDNNKLTRIFCTEKQQQQQQEQQQTGYIAIDVWYLCLSQITTFISAM